MKKSTKLSKTCQSRTKLSRCKRKSENTGATVRRSARLALYSAKRSLPPSTAITSVGRKRSKKSDGQPVSRRRTAEIPMTLDLEGHLKSSNGRQSQSATVGRRISGRKTNVSDTAVNDKLLYQRSAEVISGAKELENKNNLKRKHTEAAPDKSNSKQKKTSMVELFEKWRTEAELAKGTSTQCGKKSLQTATSEQSSSGSEDEWEDVVDGDCNGIVITVDKPVASIAGDLIHRKEANEARQEIVKRLNRRQLNCHKAHLLCYIAHLKLLARSIIVNTDLKGLCFSLLPAQFIAKIGTKFNTLLAKKFIIWFNATFSCTLDSPPDVHKFNQTQVSRLMDIIGKQVYGNDMDAALIVFIYMLLFKKPVRLVMNCTPVPYKKNVESLLEREYNWIRRYKCRGCPGDSSFLNEGRRGKSKRFAKEGKSGVNSTVTQKKRQLPLRSGAGGKDSVVKKVIGEKLSRSYWIEFWDERSSRWICVDPCLGTVDEPESIETTASPLQYVLAVDNVLGLSEVTARYASRFLFRDFRTNRIDGSWWTETLEIFSSKDKERAELENAKLMKFLLSKPMPVTFAGFKNHFLYVLDRDILKFEAIYPPNTKPIGKFGNCKIYLRSSLSKLRTSLNWLKEARSVKNGEKPYKVVGGVHCNPKVSEEARLKKIYELFGYWQTEPFRAPEPVNGKIVRNEFGNIYLFKPSMLPVGCVHIRNCDGLLRVARMLNVECVPCVVGWDFHKSGNHAVLDGYAVLKKDARKLVRAWEKESSKKQERILETCREGAEELEEVVQRCIANEARAKEVQGHYLSVISGKFLLLKLHINGADEASLDSEETRAVYDEEQVTDDTKSAWPYIKFDLPLTIKSDG